MIRDHGRSVPTASFFSGGLSMNGRAAIQSALDSTKHLLQWYVSDLSDADLLVRPAPGANHIAWQLGHLISAEGHLANGQLPGASYPELPAGFNDTYGS